MPRNKKAVKALSGIDLRARSQVLARSGDAMLGGYGRDLRGWEASSSCSRSVVNLYAPRVKLASLSIARSEERGGGREHICIPRIAIYSTEWSKNACPTPLYLPVC